MRAVIFAGLLSARVALAQPAEPAPMPEPAPEPAAEPAAPETKASPETPPAPVDDAPPAAESEAPALDPTAAPAPATPLPAVPDAVTPSRNKDAAWLFVGGAITFATAGTVLAYSTSSAEQDLKDLYVSSGSNPPRFDDNTRRRYDDLVDEGERFQVLSMISFGIAGVCAAGAGYFFWRASHESVTITPVITPTTAGVSVRF